MHLLLEADGFEGAAGACARAGQQLQYAMLLPGSASSRALMGRLTVTQQAAEAPSSFRWQRFFCMDGSALQFNIDMGDAQAVPAPTQSYPGSAVQPQDDIPQNTDPVATKTDQLTGTTAAAASATPGAEKFPVTAAAAVAEEAAAEAAWDRSVPLFLQLAHPICPASATVSATGGSCARGISNGEGSFKKRALSALLPARLAMWLYQQLRREEVALGISAACVLELLLIAGLALLCSCRPKLSGPPQAAPRQQHPGPSLPLPAGHATPQQPKPALRDACCSPMPVWSSPAALLQALRSPPAWSRPRLESIQEEDESGGEQGAGRQQEAVGWTRQVMSIACSTRSGSQGSCWQGRQGSTLFELLGLEASIAKAGVAEALPTALLQGCQA